MSPPFSTTRRLLGCLDRKGSLLRALLTLLACVGWGFPALASETSPGLNPRALPGIAEVGLPAPAPHGFSLAAGLGAGWIDPIGTPAVEAARLGGSIAVAYSPLPALALGLDFSGHADWLSTPEENATSEPRLTLRALVLRSGPVRLGLEADVRFVGATAPSIDWAATSPSLSALVACRPTSGTWLGGTLGFHLDRSAEAVPDPSAVSPADRITLGASSAPAVRLGLGVTHELVAAKVVLLGEVSADLLVSESAPPLEQSPMRLSAGARYHISPALSLLALASAGLSARPDALTGDTLQPIEPRLAGQLAVTWTIQPAKHEPAPAAAAPAAAPPPPPPPVPPAAPRSAVRGRVVDEAGQGLPDVEVTLELSTETVSVRTAADGSFEFPEIEDSAVGRARASASGYDPAEADVPPSRERQVELVLYPAVPAGQVRGTVVDLQGRPVAAKITIDPGNQVLEVRPDGTFNIELKPGEYRLRAEHPDFSPQGRVIVVVERGVVILHIALTP